jgi:NAD(P)H-quinone oxidoreductase subunit 5
VTSSSLAIVEASLFLALLAPLGLLLGLGAMGLLPGRIPERVVGAVTSAAILLSACALVLALVVYLSTDMSPFMLGAHGWFSTPGGTVRFDLLIDGWSLAFALLSVTIAGVVSAFSYRYLHREAGFMRYFTLSAAFVVGMLFIALAGSMELLFAGWEFVGISSALLVAFFHERRAPVANAMRVYATYRVSDAAMLIAAILLHHAVGSGSLSAIVAPGAGPLGQSLSTGEATAIGICLVAAVAGKSALFPFSGWLPRAMEGPTPSSAVFYGALSVHAGCYLLWRASPLVEQSLPMQVLAASAGIATAVYGTLVVRVQTDLKSALSYATLTQIGVIVTEIALGLRTLAFVHLVGHACFRLLQFLSAPNILHDLHTLESYARSSEHAASQDERAGKKSDSRGPGRLYLFCLERGFVDAIVDRWIVSPFLWLARRAQRLDLALAGDRPTLGADESREELER